MTKIPKNNARAKSEYTSEGTPRLVADTCVRSVEGAALESPKPEVRPIHVPKLDQQTVWRLIETLKSL